MTVRTLSLALGIGFAAGSLSATARAADASPEPQLPSPDSPPAGATDHSSDASSGDAASEAASDSPDASRDHGPPTLFGSQVVLSGYGGFDFAYTRMFGQDGAVAGARAALLVNHHLSLGVAGFGWVDPHDGKPGDDPRDLGYGGFIAHYSFYLPDLPVCITLGGLVGGGAIEWGPAADGTGALSGTHDSFFVAQPELSLDANLTAWLRVGLTGGYRFTSGVERGGLSSSDVDGPLVGAHLQLGRF